MAALSVEGLNKTFRGGLFEKDRHVLRDVSFSLEEGKTVGFVGSNGSGKTTTIKCLFNFIRPDSGQIRFFGQELGNDVKTRIGYLPERPYLYEFLTGEEFLKLHWNLCYGSMTKDFSERAMDSLRMVDLMEAKDRRLRTYSKGMLQRIGIAQAILTRPELLILDEPTSGLDFIAREELLCTIQQLATSEDAPTIIFVTHHIEEVLPVFSHTLLLEDGTVFAKGERKEVLTSENMSKLYGKEIDVDWRQDRAWLSLV